MPEHDSHSLLALSVQPQLIQACLMEPIQGVYRLVGWTDLCLEEGADLPVGIERTCRRLGSNLGRVLWDQGRGQPLLQSAEPALYPPLHQVVAVANLRPPLRVWLAGLSGQAAAMAGRAIASSSAQLVSCYRWTHQDDAGRLAADLLATAPDVAVIAAGYDRPAVDAQGPVLALSTLLGKALEYVAPSRRPHIIYAGNHWAGEQAGRLLCPPDGEGSLETVVNVQPGPGWLHQPGLASALNRHYWALCGTDPHLAVLNRWITSPSQVRGIDWSFAQAVRTWMLYQSLPRLHGLYCGPAWWLHVWASREQPGVHRIWTPPGSCPDELAAWPPVQLVSGRWPERHWPRPARYWWDRAALVPAIMGTGQVNPQAAFQVLAQDVLAA